jgi:hypothetical protein
MSHDPADLLRQLEQLAAEVNQPPGAGPSRPPPALPPSLPFDDHRPPSPVTAEGHRARMRAVVVERQ